MRCAAAAAVLPSFLRSRLQRKKICFHLSSCEAAKSGDNGADRRSVGETEELDHICAALVTHTHSHSGRARRSPERSHLAGHRGAAGSFVFPPHPSSYLLYCERSGTGASASAEQPGGNRLGRGPELASSPSNIHGGTPERAAVTPLCFHQTAVIAALFLTGVRVPSHVVYM